MPPKRIISLVPSETELLSALGLNEETIGITKFCVRPEEWFRSKTRIGGTKTVDIEKIKGLKPDLILANKEENVKEQVDQLSELFPVHVSDVKNFDDGLKLISKIGELTGRENEAVAITKKIRNNFEQFNTHHSSLKTACYLIWKNPIMTIGGDTFISDMMKKAGFENIYRDSDRYPQITIAELQEKNPELILLSSEPFPFKQKHIDELQPHFPDSKILLVDGEMFSWYGSRMMFAGDYFEDISRRIFPTDLTDLHR